MTEPRELRPYEDERAKLSALIGHMVELADTILADFDSNSPIANHTGSAIRSAARNLQDHLDDWDESEGGA